ncbi:MAG: GerMN domain-containing protein [Acidobacteriota bacterium]
MKRVFLYLISLLIVIVVAVVVIVMVLLKGEGVVEPVISEKSSVYGETGSSIPTVGVTLFFHDPEEDFLIPEKRNIFSMPFLTDRARQLVVELMRGPGMGGVSTIPPGTTLHELYVLKDGTVCIDLSREFEENADGGSSSQLLQIYSVVNSLTYNFPEIKGVRIFIEGEQKTSFGGHIYSAGVFREKLSLVKFPESMLPPETGEVETFQNGELQEGSLPVGESPEDTSTEDREDAESLEKDEEPEPVP